MAAVSAQDEFTRWAKLRRQHDKALEAHDKKGIVLLLPLSTQHELMSIPAAAVTSSKSSFETRATMTRWVSTSGLRFAIQFWHSKTPVFTYPQGWVPWYVEWTLGFPRCPRGGVSINIWSAACAAAITLVSDVLISLVSSMPSVQRKQKAPAMKINAEKKRI